MELVLRMSQDLTQSNPDAVHLQQLSEAWVQMAKCCVRDEPQGVEPALTEAASAARRLRALGSEHRFLLDDRLRRLARYRGAQCQREEAAACLHECESLWPDNADGLRGVARGFRELAGEARHWWAELSPAEKDEQQRYLAEAVRLEKVADALRP